MTTVTKILNMSVAAALLASTWLTPALARDTVAVLSPRQTPADLRGQAETLVSHLAATLKPGETAVVVDGAEGRLVAELRVPEGEAYDNPRAKLQANKAALGALKRWFDGAQASPGRVGQIDLPKTLRLIRLNYPTGGGADLIVLASPIWAEADAPSWSMQRGRVPGDGLVSAPAGESPFGTAGLSGSLAGYDVRFGLIGPEASVSPAHAHALERFWTLEVEAQGGSMAFYGDDLATLFRGAGTDAPDGRHAEPLVPTEKREMMVFRPDTGRAAAPGPETTTEASDWTAAQGVSIGVRWTQKNSDLDLYVRPASGAPVVYYGQAETPEGRLYKDLRDAPRGGYETIALDGPVDLGQVMIWVDHFSGRVPEGGLTGELSIAVGERAWTQAFVLTEPGDRGAGAEAAIRGDAAPNGAWAVFRPLEAMGE